MISLLSSNDIIILKEIFEELTDEYNLTELTLDELNEIKDLFSDILITLYDRKDLLFLVDSLFEIRYSIDNIKKLDIIKISEINFKTIEEKDNIYNKYRLSVINSLLDKEKEIFNQYEFLINQPQPIQKSKEWFQLRNNMITASNCAAVLGLDHYKSIKEILLDKLDLSVNMYKENDNVYHGKKYEKIAIMIYEIMQNSKVGEFGLIPHPDISFLGASPDGINMSLTLDGEKNKLMGRMIEIKCPTKRKICNSGKIIGKICPEHYWIQIQVQLECCNLNECDFWQCNIEEFATEDEFINYDNTGINTFNELLEQNENSKSDNNLENKLDKRICKGLIIELLPINDLNIDKNDKIIWYAKYIYPPSLLFTVKEYLEWSSYVKNNLLILYPDLYKYYKFSRNVYWKLVNSHCELIVRQPEWFKKNYAAYKLFWDRVEYYRMNIEEAKNLFFQKNQKFNNEFFLNNSNIKLELKKYNLFD